MKRKRHILLVLAVLTVVLPGVWGYHHGSQRADRYLQENPGRCPDPEDYRIRSSMHGAVGMADIGFFVVVYMVVSRAFIKGFGHVFDGVCSIVGFVVGKVRTGTEHHTERYRRGPPKR